MMEGVASSTVVRFGSTAATPARRLGRIMHHTDLMRVPDDEQWSTTTTNRTAAAPPSSTAGSLVSDFSSFVIAEQTSELIGGQVDVVSDSDNIKQLLRLPYAPQETISLAVHRVGKTVLLDRFDATRGSTSAAPADNAVNSSASPDTASTKKALEDRMYHKLLYYTLSDEGPGTEPPNRPSESAIDGPTSLTVPSTPSVNAVVPMTFPQSPPLTSHLLSDYFSLVRPTASPINTFATSSSFSAGPTTAQERATQVPAVTPKDPLFQRIVHWNFQDLSMLVGSNLLIFGDDKHPAVSLKLRDASQPINVLTGIDDWLDNLMCNVPEVAMCYHLNGVIQSFDLIKTEDMPRLSGSSFSPVAILETAQNMLSFLKRNCTREGGTYWLYKSANDDVVKLYDLSNLRPESPKPVASISINERSPSTARNSTKSSWPTPPPPPQDNAFALPVAMLLYRMAKNMSKSKTERDSKALVLLLTNCLQLLHNMRELYPIVYSSALRLLADVYVQEGILLPNADSSPESSTSPELVDSDNNKTNADEEFNYFLPRLGLVGRASPPRASDPNVHTRDVSDSQRGFVAGRLELSRALDLLFQGLNAFVGVKPAVVCAQADPILTRISEISARLASLESAHIAPLELSPSSVCMSVGWFALAVLSNPKLGESVLITAADVLFRASMLARKESTRAEMITLSRQYSSQMNERQALVAHITDQREIEQSISHALDTYSPVSLLSAAALLYNDATTRVGTTSSMIETARRRLGNAYNELGSLYMQQQEYEAAHEAFDQSLHEFDRTDDLVNRALVLCNLARIGLVRPSQGEVEDIKSMQSTISSFRRAKEVLKGRHTHPQIYDAVIHELGQAHFALASYKHRQMQESGIEDDNSGGPVIIDHFLASIACFEEQLKQPLTAQVESKVRKSAAIAHFRLAHMHHRTVVRGNATKLVRNLALSHYDKAFAFLDPKREPLVYVQSRLEWAQLTETQTPSHNRPVSGDKLQFVLDRLLECRVALGQPAAVDEYGTNSLADSSDDEHVTDERALTEVMSTLCTELVARLQTVLLDLAKQRGMGANTAIKEMYEHIIRSGSPIIRGAASAHAEVIQATRQLLDELMGQHDGRLS